jgi:hypothetical protein
MTTMNGAKSFQRCKTSFAEKRLVISLLLAIVCCALATLSPHNICNAQGSSLVRKLNVQILPEEGSPVAVTSAKSEADLDPFGAPISIRTYADYKNVSRKPILGVKFRVRYVDAEGKDRGTFHAPHASSLGPGMTATEKWKREKVDPRIVGMMIRVLAVKFSDGSVWESSKLGNVVKPAGSEPQLSEPVEEPAASEPAAGEPTIAEPAAPAQPTGEAAPARTLQTEPAPAGGPDAFGGGSQ